MTMVIPTPDVVEPGFGNCHVLICDPYPANRRLLREVLDALGCGEVEGCATLRDAWRRLNDGGIDVLFLDWSEDTDAIAFLRAIRTPDHPWRFLPVVVMTPQAGRDVAATARDAGATEFMLLPWSRQVVESRLRSVLRHPRLFIAAGSFFGPDRRRRHVDFPGPERRQGHAGLMPLERRHAPRI